MKSKPKKVTMSVTRPPRALFSKTETIDKNLENKIEKKEIRNERASQTAIQAVNIAQLRESFDAQAENRKTWLAKDYSELIQKLDRLQTEAFILKGKLLAEAKQKFFDSNKVGWADFCEQKLFMNYTTANQYIRVSLEFDVTSHQYPNLGFEHFKALLPVAAEERPKVLENFGNGSVKSLRNFVAKSSKRPEDGFKTNAHGVQTAKQFLNSLQMLHVNLKSVETSQLSVQFKWQLAAACNQVANSLQNFATQTLETDFAAQQSPTHARSGGVASYQISESEETEDAS